MQLSFETLAWAFIVLQVVGLASALATRVSEGSKLQCPCQRLFVMLLALVAVGTFAVLTVDVGQTLLGGTTFALMSLTAICDFRSPRRLA